MVLCLQGRTLERALHTHVCTGTKKPCHRNGCIALLWLDHTTKGCNITKWLFAQLLGIPLTRCWSAVDYMARHDSVNVI